MRWHSRRVAAVGVGMASSRAEAEAAPCRRGASRDGRRARRGLRRARQTRLAQTTGPFLTTACVTVGVRAGDLSVARVHAVPGSSDGSPQLQLSDADVRSYARNGGGRNCLWDYGILEYGAWRPVYRTIRGVSTGSWRGGSGLPTPRSPGPRTRTPAHPGSSPRCRTPCGSAGMDARCARPSPHPSTAATARTGSPTRCC